MNCQLELPCNKLTYLAVFRITAKIFANIYFALISIYNHRRDENFGKPNIFWQTQHFLANPTFFGKPNPTRSRNTMNIFNINYIHVFGRLPW